jgi:two-component system LytT family response regulator
VDTVTYFEAEGPYVELHTDDGGRHLIRERMKTLEAQLDPANFCRIHRSTIVNLNFVDAVQPNYEDRYVVVLSTGERLDVSRRRRERFENRFGLSF